MRYVTVVAGVPVDWWRSLFLVFAPDLDGARRRVVERARLDEEGPYLNGFDQSVRRVLAALDRVELVGPDITDRCEVYADRLDDGPLDSLPWPPQPEESETRHTGIVGVPWHEGPDGEILDEEAWYSASLHFALPRPDEGVAEITRRVVVVRAADFPEAREVALEWGRGRARDGGSELAAIVTLDLLGPAVVDGQEVFSESGWAGDEPDDPDDPVDPVVTSGDGPDGLPSVGA
ncbi:MAG: hypothetical protein LBR33_01890 [Propionibacteriaceae bacterium]|nr:hypothetical protein [Propionibacteriaceae bacterium]